MSVVGGSSVIQSCAEIDPLNGMHSAHAVDRLYGGFRWKFRMVRRISDGGIHGGNGDTFSSARYGFIIFYEIFQPAEKAHASFKEVGGIFDFIDGTGSYVGSV